MKWPNLVSLFYLNKKDRLIHMSVMDVERVERKERTTKSDEVIVIMLITIFILLFFATSLKVFITLLISGLVIGVVGLIKNYKRRE